MHDRHVGTVDELYVPYVCKNYGTRDDIHHEHFCLDPEPESDSAFAPQGDATVAPSSLASASSAVAPKVAPCKLIDDIVAQMMNQKGEVDKRLYAVMRPVPPLAVVQLGGVTHCTADYFTLVNIPLGGGAPPEASPLYISSEGPPPLCICFQTFNYRGVQLSLFLFGQNIKKQ